MGHRSRKRIGALNARRNLLRVWRANIRKHGTERPLIRYGRRFFSDYGVAKNIAGRGTDRYITGDIDHVVVNAAVPTESVHAVRQHQRLGVGLRGSGPAVCDSTRAFPISALGTARSTPAAGIPISMAILRMSRKLRFLALLTRIHRIMY